MVVRKTRKQTKHVYYHVVGMFGGVNVWRIAELKVIGEIKFGEWIDFGHKDTIYQLKFG